MLPVLMGIAGTELSAEETQAVRDLQPAGFVLFSRNMENVEQIRRLTDSLRASCLYHHPVIAIDQEGGRVVRTAALGIHLPSASALADRADDKDIALAGALTARILRCLGINLNFAPVLDICHDPNVANALPSRCWGDNPQRVISHAGVFAANMQRVGVMSCGKHFPGMGLACIDPHMDLPVINEDEETLFKGDLLPFSALDQVMTTMMTAHIRLPQLDPVYPASLSRSIIGDLLRSRFRYKGVVFTDDLCMGAITKYYSTSEAVELAWHAGCDIPLICHDPLPILESVNRRYNSLNPWHQDEIEKRTESLSNRLAFPYPDISIIWPECCEEATQLCLRNPEPVSVTGSSPVESY